MKTNTTKNNSNEGKQLTSWTPSCESCEHRYVCDAEFLHHYTNSRDICPHWSGWIPIGYSTPQDNSSILAIIYSNIGGQTIPVQFVFGEFYNCLNGEVIPTENIICWRNIPGLIK